MFGENARVNEVPERNFWRLEEKERKKNRKY
jgi:hypothetical protein